MRDVFECTASHPQHQLEELLVDRWEATKARANLRPFGRLAPSGARKALFSNTSPSGPCFKSDYCAADSPDPVAQRRTWAAIRMNEVESTNGVFVGPLRVN
jgi:hypothetical protein